MVLLLLAPVLASWPVVFGWLTVNPLPWSGIVNSSPPVIGGMTTLDPNVGLTTQALGRFAALQWLHGSVPWWNPYEGVGLPLAAEGQNPALFLPFVLLLALHNGPFLLKLLLQEVAGVSTFLLLRQMGLARAAALLGGLLFALNGTFARFGHGPVMPIAFLPLLLLGIEKAARIAERPGTASGWAGWPLAAIALAFSIYAAFPETTYLNLLLVFVWALVRLITCAPAARLRLLGALTLAAITGLMLAIPFILPFAELLRVGDVGMHAGRGLAMLHMPLAGLALLIMPTVYGPPGMMPLGPPSEPVTWIWDFVGGDVTPPVLCLALLALAGGRARPYRLLRWVLAAWCLAMIGTSFGLPVVSRLIESVPLMGETQIFRYSGPSWEMAFAILAAFALDDSLQATRPPRFRIPVIAVAAMLFILIALLLGRPAILILAHSYPRYGWRLARCVLVTLAVLAVALLLLAWNPRRQGAALLTAVLGIQAMVLYALPILSGTAHQTAMTGGVTFLRNNLGLDRFYTLGPIRPNYPTYYGIASINSDYLPAPRLWTAFVSGALDPTTDPLAFSGQSGIPGMPFPDHAVALNWNIQAYRALGVRYVVSSPGSEPLDDLRLNAVVQPAVTSSWLAPGHPFDTTVTPAELQPGSLRALTVSLGTFGGRSRGPLTVLACAGGSCETGSRDLATAADDGPFELDLGAPLPLPRGTVLRLHFTKAGPSPVVIWLYRDRLTGQVVPGLGLIYADGGVQHRRVYQDAVMEIDAITGTAPYMQTTGGPCTLRDMARDAVTADCSGPARLIRRVFTYPGWRAHVNGRPVPVGAYPPIFQVIPLLSGTNQVRFRYAPPFAPAMAGAFFAGLLLLLWGCVGPGAGRRHRAASGSNSATE